MRHLVPVVVLTSAALIIVGVGFRSNEPAFAPKQLPSYAPEPHVAQPLQLSAPPAQPVVVKPRPSDEARVVVPVKVAASPLSVNILGPTVQAIDDGPLRFSAVLTGQPAAIKWRVRKIDVEVPVDSRGLTITDNGVNASFSGPKGFYILGVAVAGTDGAVDWYWHDFEISEGIVMKPPEEPATTEPEQPTATAEPSPPAQPQENIASYVSRLVNSSVQSPTRTADAVSVGGCFRAVAAQIQTGQYTGSDPMTDVRRQTQLALNTTAASWEPFFAGIDALLAHLRQRGLATTTENVGAILGEVGNVLASAR